MRINKYLADKNIASRRKADEMIKAKRVLINGRIAVLGDSVCEADTITVKKDKNDIGTLYFAYNKPKDVLSHSAKGSDFDIQKMVKGRTDGAKVFPIGRLDKDSHGLIILTNDGRITKQLLNPEENHEKEYIVQTKLKIDEKFIRSIEKGVTIKEDYSKKTYTTKPCLAKILGQKKFSLVITEGKKRQIRRMVEALRNEVTDLMRVRIMNIELGNLKENGIRRITGEDLQHFLNDLQMNK